MKTMLENKASCVCVGSLDYGVYANMHEQSRRVYDPHYLSPTIATFCGGNQEIKIIVARERERSIIIMLLVLLFLKVIIMVVGKLGMIF